MVDNKTEHDSSLGILTQQKMIPDYLFFGETFNRKITPITKLKNLAPQAGKLDFLLVGPDFANRNFPGYKFISSQDGWRLFCSQ
jgi:hypothetical protein